MEDSAMILRAKFMAKPGQQFMIRKEVYRRVQQAFKEAGIEFAHREVTVHVPGISDQPPTGEAEPAAGAAPNTVKREEAVKPNFNSGLKKVVLPQWVTPGAPVVSTTFRRFAGGQAVRSR
jgi:hypothetical protein